MNPIEIAQELAVTDETPKVLTTSAVGEPALPSGGLDGGDRTLELGLRRVLAAQTGIGVGYAEQLYSFGDIDRSSENISSVISDWKKPGAMPLTRTPRRAHWAASSRVMFTTAPFEAA